MPKQIFRISDFSGNLNKEDDPSDLADNECLFIENLVPYGKGILKLDRDRSVVKAGQNHAGTISMDASNPIIAVGSWKDTANQIVIPIMYKLAGETYLTYLAATGEIDTNVPILGTANKLATYTSDWGGKSMIWAHSGVLRIGGDHLSAPSAITNFTTITGGASYLRYRFNTDADYVLGGLAVFSDFNVNRGCGVYAPRVEFTDDLSGGLPIGTDGTFVVGTYTEHTVGLYAAESNAVTGSYFVAGDKIRYGITLEYDYNQESPMAVCGSPSQSTVTIATAGNSIRLNVFVPSGTPAANPGWWPTLATFNTDVDIFDERITAINIYRSINNGDFFHLYRVGLSSVACVGDNGAAQGWEELTDLWCLLRHDTAADLFDMGYYRTETYQSRTGFIDWIEYKINAGSADSVNTSSKLAYDNEPLLRWDKGFLFRNMAIVNSRAYFKDGYWVNNPHKRQYISKQGAPDVFYPDRFITVGDKETTTILAGASLSLDRFVLWDANNTYVINASSSDVLGWFIEKTYNLGIIGGNGYAIMPKGVAFINAKGAYLLDEYGNLVEASRKFRSAWQTFIAAGMQMHFDRKWNVLYYTKTGLTANYAGMMLDLERGSWTYWSDDQNYGSFGNNVIQYCQGMAEGYSGETHLVNYDSTNSKIRSYTIKASEIAIRTSYQSPFLDMGDPSLQKRGKHIWVKYKSAATVTVGFYRDNGTSLTTLKTLAASATMPSITKVRFPYKYKTVSIYIKNEADNNGVFELYEISIEYSPIRNL